MRRRVAVITGGNAGIGLALARRLLTWDPDLQLCLACRSEARAEAARNNLLSIHPGATVSIVLVDVGSVSSVYQAVKELKDRFKHIDLLYLNAGIMPVSQVNWAYFWRTIFSRESVHMLVTGDGLLSQVDGVTPEGLQKIFATNLFGHFVMIRELEDQLGGPEGDTQIVWTSSSNAKKEAFSMGDCQHATGSEPYGSSKYASDLLSLAINERSNKKGVYSHVTCPGLVMTNITYGILPSWFWVLIFPIMWLLRLFTHNMNVTPENGSEALFWLAQQKPQSLDPRSKYLSLVNVLGQRYTKGRKMDIESDTAKALYEQLCHMEEKMKPK